MRFKQYLLEKKNEDEKEKIIFKETDGRSPFPEMTMNELEKKITSLAKDLEKEWESANVLVDSVFEELNVPKPQVHLVERWRQYTDLIAHAVKQLYKARGLKSGWTQTV